ncbi:unnamed protein product [Rotaria sp. Silwood1]|nr:unnamed protein product [Rotaria sp. Silwood1]CAF3879069.1 unnamed protein product [Rotaria sp. Silwood1]CAF4938920.1 unnamed protein product [Rotaria sp. Silwood1]CAF4946887.1 unnamed protein product [Rotaria sp. Silwood1]CAF4996954.1 unnamed protein product [Rotaria sp. Silwood1]
MHQHSSFINILNIVTIILLIVISSQSTPLDDYVRAEDPHFGWSLIQMYDEPDYKLYILNFTSQKWYDETFSSRPIWWHYLCVIIPHKLTRPNTAFMLIDQGSNTDRIPQPQDDFVALTSMVAVGTGSIAVDLQDIPNAPIRFPADPTNRSRHEDSLIAWTWKTFIDNSSNLYAPINIPMTKASYRAMDAVQQFTDNQNITTPKTFILAGASKRGWPTWLTAAVDNERVIAAIPIVMDILNFQTNLHHHYRSLVGWTFAFNDYFNLNITQYIDSEIFTQMAETIDPYYYFDRYAKMKILQIQSTGDEFFLLDNEAAFWNKLQIATGGTYLRRIPNAEHTCIGHIISLFFTMRSFYLSIYDNRPLPQLQWIKSSNNTHGYIRATVDFSVGPKPISALGYRARTLNNKRRRDFRLLIANPDDPTKSMVNPVFWFTTDLVIEAETNTTIVYSLTIANPMDGWEGFLIQVNFPGPDGTALELTTETQIIPDTYPTSDCHDIQCWGTLV